MSSSMELVISMEDHSIPSLMTKPPPSSYKLTTCLSDQGQDYIELQGDNATMRFGFEAVIVMLQVCHAFDVMWMGSKLEE